MLMKAFPDCSWLIQVHYAVFLAIPGQYVLQEALSPEKSLLLPAEDTVISPFLPAMWGMACATAVLLAIFFLLRLLIQSGP